MQITRLAFLVAAASSSSSGGGALASSPADMAYEIRGLDLGVGGAGGLPLVVPRQTGTTNNNKNLQTFTGALGGIKADAVSKHLNPDTLPSRLDGMDG